MCLSSLWTQPPYNDRNSLICLIPQNLNSINYQAILILEWITSTLFHLQYHEWGETLKQGIEPPIAPWVPQHYGCPLLRVCVFTLCVCSLLCVCTWMGWMQSTNSKFGSPYLATHHFTFTKLIYACLRKSFYCRLFFFNKGQFKAGFVKKLQLKDDHFHRRERRGEQWSLACKEIYTEMSHCEQSCFDKVKRVLFYTTPETISRRP